MVLLFSFHAVTCVRNHVFIAQHRIRLWVHSSISEAAASGGLLQTNPVPEKMLLGKRRWTTPASSSLCPAKGTLQGWVQTAAYLLCPGAELVSQLCLGSGWLRLPELTASTKELSSAQGQLMPYHVSTLRSPKWSQKLKSQEMMKLSYSTPLNQELAVRLPLDWQQWLRPDRLLWCPVLLLSSIRKMPQREQHCVLVCLTICSLQNGPKIAANITNPGQLDWWAAGMWGMRICYVSPLISQHKQPCFPLGFGRELWYLQVSNAPEKTLISAWDEEASKDGTGFAA